MVFITESLIRKRSEHNECLISTLEEIALHQQDIEKIEYIDKWCRDLKILLLQSNLIPKIENVGRLKKLEYLNLALNLVEKIENLEGCESLNKLDLTVNFIGEITSVESLKGLYNLQELYLTGNPCTEYVGYREYVIATLPQLQKLDGIEIEKSERIKATQILHKTRPDMIHQQAIYKKKRKKQQEEELAKAEGKKIPDKSGTNWYTDIQTGEQFPRIVEIEDCNEDEEQKEKTDEEINKEFWEEKCAYTPESRIAVHKHLQKVRKKDEAKEVEKKKKKPPRMLVTEDGKVLNVNEAKVDFHFKEEPDCIILDVAMYKHMDTSLCDVDVQPTYVKVMLKGKVLQLVLQEEVKPDSSSAKRSEITGHLIITMPKVNPVIVPEKAKKVIKNEENLSTKPGYKKGIRHEKLEVEPSKFTNPDICNIVSEKSKMERMPLGSKPKRIVKERANSEGFEDDPDVPPLM